MSTPIHRALSGPMRWREVEVREYKKANSGPFRDVTRQVLFDDPSLSCQLRYFEVAPGGHTTLERHEHAHAVLIEHGHGRCLVGEHVYDVAEHDLVHIPPLTWHQFRSGKVEPLGFLCMVNSVRDRPQLPTTEELRNLLENPVVGKFIAR